MWTRRSMSSSNSGRSDMGEVSRCEPLLATILPDIGQAYAIWPPIMWQIAHRRPLMSNGSGRQSAQDCSNSRVSRINSAGVLLGDLEVHRAGTQEAVSPCGVGKTRTALEHRLRKFGLVHFIGV